jgi:probable rRNA maturation factor
VVVTVAGTTRPVARAAIRRAVQFVLRRERAGPSTITVTQLSSQRMRALNRRTFGRDRSTDVIAFGMRHGGRLIGDVYVCPTAAVRSAAALGLRGRDELVRLAVHGTLHVLGYDHPAGAVARTRSAMWRRQERHLAALARDRSS